MHGRRIEENTSVTMNATWMAFLRRKNIRKVRVMEVVTVEEAALRITDRSLLPLPLALIVLRLRVTTLLPCNVAVILYRMIRPFRFFTP